jgi:hypothetical protein
MKLEEPTCEAVLGVLLVQAIGQTTPVDQVAAQVDVWIADPEINALLGYAKFLGKCAAGKTYEEVVRNLMALAGVTEQGEKIRSLLDAAIARI